VPPPRNCSAIIFENTTPFFNTKHLKPRHISVKAM